LRRERAHLARRRRDAALLERLVDDVLDDAQDTQERLDVGIDGELAFAARDFNLALSQRRKKLRQEALDVHVPSGRLLR